MTDTEVPGLLSTDLPFEFRTCPHLRQARRGAAARRVRTPAGDEAWLVSGHDEIKKLLIGRQLGRSHPTPEARAQYAHDPLYDQVESHDHAVADTAHAAVRAAVKPHFTARRMLRLRPTLATLVEGQVDQLIEHGPPAELRADFSGPLIRRVFTELFAVPAADRDRCLEVMRLGSEDGLGDLFEFVTELAATKAAAPDDSLMARLAASGLHGDQVVRIAMLLYLAGTGATSNQIDYGILLLAEESAQRERLAANPDQLPVAIEEMLRLAGSLTLPRYAREDFEIGDSTISAGDLVLLDLVDGNYDEDAFAEPTTFEAERRPNRHLTFGHGSWTCPGAPLARQVMQLVFASLLTRLPTLRPALPPGSTTGGPLTGGLPTTLEITW